MHLYYEYPNSGSALTASADVYDLNAPPRDQRTSLYAYSVYPHTGSTDPRCVVQYEDDTVKVVPAVLPDRLKEPLNP